MPQLDRRGNVTESRILGHRIPFCCILPYGLRLGNFPNTKIHEFKNMILSYYISDYFFPVVFWKKLHGAISFSTRSSNFTFLSLLVYLGIKRLFKQFKCRKEFCCGDPALRIIHFLD